LTSSLQKKKKFIAGIGNSEFSGLTAAYSAVNVEPQFYTPSLWHSSVLTRSRWYLSQFSR